MCEGIPVPELTEQNHSNDSAGVRASSSALQTDGDIPASSIDEALANGSTKASHGVFVLVRYDFVVFGTRCGKRWRRCFRLFNEDHAECDEGSLADEVDAVFGHGFQDLNGVLCTSQ